MSPDRNPRWGCSCRLRGSGSGHSAGKVPCSLPCRACGRQGEEHLFAHDIFKGKSALFIVPDFGLVEGNCAFAGLGVGGLGAEDEVEVAAERGADGLDAAGAEELEVAGEGGADADVGDLLVVAAVFDDEVGAAGDGEGADLGDVGERSRARRRGWIPGRGGVLVRVAAG